jgi:hypothetical protein
LPLAAAVLAAGLGASSAVAVGAPPEASPAAARHCARIVNPEEGTRYDGIDLRRIRAVGVSCRRARQVVRGVHHKALGITPPPSGVRRFGWRDWSVTGDIRPETDRYLATRGAKRVRWVF